ncbi:MAG TPA: penicillin-binding transpeptidase domain-containing protein [Acidimicrobiales bacterium]
MNSRIRRLGVVVAALYAALFVQLNLLHLVRADEYSAHPANSRAIKRDFEQPRGTIQTADGVVVARSVIVNGPFERQREYPEGELFAPVTGFFSFTFGTDGVERSYNAELTGRDIEVRIRNIADLFVDRRPTGNITLTVAKSVQQAAAQALGDRRGAVVAVNPQTGAVLALWSSPSFDPNELSQHDQSAVTAARQAMLDNPAKPLTNRAIRERYFPGSTFKIVTATAALETGTVTPTEPVYPTLSALDLPTTNRPLTNFGGSSCGGNLFRVIQVSCNTAFGQMGLDVGAEALADAAAGYGFGQVPPLDLPAVVAATFPPLEAFDRNLPAVAQSAIGQFDVQATPLQMALMAAAVVNGGSIVRPQVVAEVRDDAGEVIARLEPREWRRAMGSETADLLEQAMIGVVDGGTATVLRTPGVSVGAKTGTAELGGEGPASHAWIIAFAPADDPKVAVAVFVEGDETTGTQTGGRIAGPIAKAVIDAVLALPDPRP